MEKQMDETVRERAERVRRDFAAGHHCIDCGGGETDELAADVIALEGERDALLMSYEEQGEVAGAQIAALEAERDAVLADRAALEAVARRLLDGWIVEDGEWRTFFDGPGEVSATLTPEESRILDLLRPVTEIASR